MFTGIILGKGRVVEKRSAGGGMVFTLESDFDLSDPEEGESIAVNGVCLTAKNISTPTWESCPSAAGSTWKGRCG
jgi:riboflavin synthase